MKTLIVDDSIIMRTAIEKFASELGLTIVGKAANGKQAVEMFQQHMPDLVTLDITMPEMNGLEALEKMLNIKPDAKILVITAITEKSVAIEALKKGAKGFLNKPFNEESVKNAIREVMGK
ncbi:MAG: response regulator [Leptospiraceae bacterium]|nr:response regulator [Leptospiraceae bacterium]